MRKIGILRGAENTFPEALIAFINAAYVGSDVHAEFVSLDSVSVDGDPAYDVILDRISPEVPFYRSFLKWAALRGTYVVNSPFFWGADDKFVGHVIASRLGVATPPTVALPHKQPPPNTQPTSFRNLRLPIDWPAVFARVGFPAFLKPHESGNRRGVTKVRNPQEFFAAYDASGTTGMMLQASIEYEDYFRCYCVGGSEVHVMRYNPGVPHDQRYSAVSRAPIPTGLRHRIEHAVRAVCNALGYDVNCVEFAVRGGTPYAVDVINPVPDADRHSVGEVNFDWVVRNTAALLVAKAEEKRAPQYEAQRTLTSQAPPRKLKVVARPPRLLPRPVVARPPVSVPPPAPPRPTAPRPEPARPGHKPAQPQAQPLKPVPAKARPAAPKPTPKPSKPVPKPLKPAAKVPKPTPVPKRAEKPVAPRPAIKAKPTALAPTAKRAKQPPKPVARAKGKPGEARRAPAPTGRRARPAKSAPKVVKPAPKKAPARAKLKVARKAVPPRKIVKKATPAKPAKAKPVRPKVEKPVARAKRPQAKTPALRKGAKGRTAKRR